VQGVDQDVREKQGLCLGLSWAGRHPALVLDSGTGQVRVPLAGTVGFRVDPGRRCTGHLAVRGSWKGRVPCPTGTVVTGAAQCPACAAADVFRFAHSFHRTGYAPQALVAYLGQPHWVYLATFADGTTKVGTAADSRRTERLDEQGPVLATFVALAADGAAARVLEDAVTAHAGLPQTVRASAKVNGWVQPGTSSGLAARHARSVDMVREVVGRAPGAAPVQEEWQPPPASAALVGGLAGCAGAGRDEGPGRGEPGRADRAHGAARVVRLPAVPGPGCPVLTSPAARFAHCGRAVSCQGRGPGCHRPGCAGAPGAFRRRGHRTSRPGGSAAGRCYWAGSRRSPLGAPAPHPEPAPRQARGVGGVRRNGVGACPVRGCAC
jgi:hypothetical protein